MNLDDPMLEICKIWEAARATSAASTFFEPIEIGPHHEVCINEKGGKFNVEVPTDICRWSTSS